MAELKQPNYDMIIKSLLGQLSRAHLRIAELEAELVPKCKKDPDPKEEQDKQSGG